MGYEEETIPCETCGEPTTFKGTKRCDNCWEVEGRLDRYLRSEKGRNYLLERINHYNPYEFQIDFAQGSNHKYFYSGGTLESTIKKAERLIHTANSHQVPVNIIIRKYSSVCKVARNKVHMIKAVDVRRIRQTAVSGT